ncbi:hypothetical protein OJE16_23055 [Pantoea tagorei]
MKQEKSQALHSGAILACFLHSAVYSSSVNAEHFFAIFALFFKRSAAGLPCVINGLFCL